MAVLVEDGEEAIVDLLVTSAFDYIDSGTGTTAADKADTALETPCGEARDQGAQSEYNAQTYQVVATHTYAGSFAITEMILNNAAAAGITMVRAVFAAVNVANGEGIEFTCRIEIQ